MQASLVSGELLGNLFWCLDYPQVEVLGLYYQVVAIRNLLLNLGNLLAWESWYDTVNEGSIYATSLLEPLLEVVAKVPQLDILRVEFYSNVVIAIGLRCEALVNVFNSLGYRDIRILL